MSDVMSVAKIPFFDTLLPANDFLGYTPEEIADELTYIDNVVKRAIARSQRKSATTWWDLRIVGNHVNIIETML